MPKFADHLTGICDILLTDTTDGETRANLGFWDNDTNLGIAAGAPVWQHFGFGSRPADPGGDDTGACMAFYVVDGDQKRVLATRDNRPSVKLPELRPGESMMFGYAGQFIRCHQNGAISIMTTVDATPDGESITLQISPEQGLMFDSPWGRLMFGPLGFHVIHTSGARIDLGAIGGLPAPLDVFGSYAKIQSDMTSLMGGAVSVGTDGGAANEASVAALITLLTALGVVIAAAVDPTGIPTAAKTTFATALATALPLLTNIGKNV